MLEKIDLSKKLCKEDYDVQIEEINIKLSNLQRKAKELGIPVTIVFEGFGAAGKGTLINKLITALDPRGFNVYSTEKASEDELMRPFLYRFAKNMPEKGRIAIFDRSWYRRVLADRIDGVTTRYQISHAFDEINSFEKQLTDDGNVIIKFFLHISKNEQKRRFDKLLSNKNTKWRVSETDLRRHKHYDEYVRYVDEMIENTDTANCPWHIIEATDKKYANVKLANVVVDSLNEAISKAASKNERIIDSHINKEAKLKTSILEGVDLNKSISKEEYKERLKKDQEKLFKLHNRIYQERIPLILAFEGWDAGGKGGAIKRVTEKLDPRGYQVFPTASPNDIERKHHYLWRFWKNMPKNGHIAIFDRTWYGRVMVERIEGFCSEDEWARAYNEINDMEKHLVNEGAIICKFWLHIDKDEQERRFKERQDNPEKQWKITEEDWRNRERWDDYMVVVDGMLLKTSTTYAPWNVIEANSKYYARLRVIETIIDAIENRLKTIDGK